MEVVEMKKMLLSLLRIFVIMTSFCIMRTFAWAQDIPKLLMLSQPLCPSCKSMEKVLDGLQSRYFLVVEDFNIREDMSVAERYGAKKTPFLIFFDKTRTQIETHAGAMSEEEILRVFEKGGVLLKEKM
jgi:thiol-disulfide isomerase/thioredoxin